jgi:hypothetical protein
MASLVLSVVYATDKRRKRRLYAHRPLSSASVPGCLGFSGSVMQASMPYAAGHAAASMAGTGCRLCRKSAARLGMRGRRENRALVAFQHLEPVVYVGGVIVAKPGRQFEVGAQEGCAKLGNKLLHGVTFVAKSFAPRSR